MDDGNIICAVFLDLKRAFETIDRDILIAKLDKYGIKDKALDWIRNYLLGRTQSVKLNNVYSDKLGIEIGVPQGSVLGPLLFLLYINDLPCVLKSCRIHLFADDTLIYMEGKDINKVIIHINEELKHVSSWLNNNKLKLNINKTKAMYIFPSQKIIESNIKIMMNSHDLEMVTEIKYLGIIIDNKLKFDKHVEYTCKKISKKINYLSRISKDLSTWSKITIYNTIILPHFIYCSTILFMCNKTEIDKLQKLQNRAMRVILKCSKYTNIETMLDSLGWLCIKNFVEYNVLIFIYKMLNNMLPQYLTKNITHVNDVHNYATRSANMLYVCKKNKVRTSMSIFHKGLILYNKLPSVVKEAKSVREFKFKVKQLL